MKQRVISNFNTYNYSFVYNQDKMHLCKLEEPSAWGFQKKSVSGVHGQAVAVTGVGESERC